MSEYGPPFLKPAPRGKKSPKWIARKVRPRRVRKTKWAADREECDKLMGRIVKVEVDRCEVCGDRRRARFQWAHGFSRRYMAVRYDRENGFCLCSGCHLTMTHNAINWTAWMRNRLGMEKYEALERRAQLPTRFPPTLVLALRVRAAELDVLTDDGWKHWQGGQAA